MAQGTSPDVFFACDVGNTRVAVGLVHGGTLRSVLRVPVAGLDGLAQCFGLDPSAGRASFPIVISSVNPPAAEGLCQMAARFTTGPCLLARRDFPVPLGVAVTNPDRVGIDRLLAALAAWQAAHEPVIIVDVGTAVTVDAVNAGGCFLGGAILPSAELGAWALHHRTAALPEVPVSGPVSAIGADTEAAIRAGLVLGGAGAIERLVAEQRRTVPAARVFGAGGAITFLKPYLPCLTDVRPDLVIEGLVAAYLAQV